MTHDTQAARAAILARLRQGKPPFEDVPAAPEHPLPVTQLSPTESADPEALLARFRAEVERLGVLFQQAANAEGALDLLLARLRAEGAQEVLVWENLPLQGVAQALESARVRPIVPKISGADRKAAYQALDAVPIGISGVDAAFATTGTLALITEAGQSRLPSLLPPLHIALLPRQNLYARPENWLHTHGAATLKRSRSVVFVTGPSRTGDIEMQIIIGVHGPKWLHIIAFD